MKDDFDLLAAWQSGSLEAGDELVRRYVARLHRFFVSKAANDAEDLVQRTLLRCVESSGRFDRTLGFKSYMYGIARNVLYEHLRQHYRAQGATSWDEEASCASMVGGNSQRAVDRLFAMQEHERIVLEALRLLPVGFQTTLELFYWESMTIDEIATALSVPSGTIKSRLARGRVMLRERLERMRRRSDVHEATWRDLAGWTHSLGQRLIPGRVAG